MVVIAGWVVVLVLVSRRQMVDLGAMTRIVHDVHVSVIVDNSVVMVHHRRSSLPKICTDPPLIFPTVQATETEVPATRPQMDDRAAPRVPR
jgi:hypothetical protein